MDAVDQFVRDGVFNQHSHSQVFIDGETLDEREAWLREVQRVCRQSETTFVVRDITSDDGLPGYQFGFADANSYIAFIHNVYGDLEGDFTRIERLDHVSDADRAAFADAAAMHLHHLGIAFKREARAGDVHFNFDRFSDRTVLAMLVENGTIAASARGLALARSYKQLVAGEDPPSPTPSTPSGPA